MENRIGQKSVSLSIGNSSGYNAMLLALTRNIKDEMAVKEALKSGNVQFAVTEIGGKSNDLSFQEKINRAVIGASLNEKVVDKTAREIHALLHATDEAKKGVLLNTTSLTSIALKIAIVRDSEWIAVAIFGESSFHPMTSHDRCGLGVMHI